MDNKIISKKDKNQHEENIEACYKILKTLNKTDFSISIIDKIKNNIILTPSVYNQSLKFAKILLDRNIACVNEIENARTKDMASLKTETTQRYAEDFLGSFRWDSFDFLPADAILGGVQDQTARNSSLGKPDTYERACFRKPLTDDFRMIWQLGKTIQREAIMNCFFLNKHPLYNQVCSLMEDVNSFNKQKEVFIQKLVERATPWYKKAWNERPEKMEDPVDLHGTPCPWAWKKAFELEDSIKDFCSVLEWMDDYLLARQNIVFLGYEESNNDEIKKLQETIVPEMSKTVNERLAEIQKSLSDIMRIFGKEPTEGKALVYLGINANEIKEQIPGILKVLLEKTNSFNSHVDNATTEEIERNGFRR